MKFLTDASDNRPTVSAEQKKERINKRKRKERENLSCGTENVISGGTENVTTGVSASLDSVVDSFFSYGVEELVDASVFLDRDEVEVVDFVLYLFE